MTKATAEARACPIDYLSPDFFSARKQKKWNRGRDQQLDETKCSGLDTPPEYSAKWDTPYQTAK